MAMTTVWWVLAGAAVAVELATGTFYLLMVAIGLAAAALGAHVGLSITVQILLAAGFGGGAVVAWHTLGRRRGAALPSGLSRDLNLDIGEVVTVEAWLEDGTAQVRYRGAQWTVVARPGNPPTLGAHRIAEVVGNKLLVDRA